MAEASRFRRRSRSASDSAEAGVEDSAGVFEIEGSLDIALEVRQLFGRDAVDSSRPTTEGTARTDSNSFPATHGRDIAVIKTTIEDKLSMYALLLKKYLSFGTWAISLSESPTPTTGHFEMCL
jgi:hypothetical protein